MRDRRRRLRLGSLAVPSRLYSHLRATTQLAPEHFYRGHASTHAHATNKHGPAQFQKYTDTAIIVHQHGNHRSMAMRSRARNASGFSLTHRFIGATSLEGNYVGILSLLDRKLRNAIENDIKTECDPNAQRVLVVNSIVHDIELSWRCRRPRSRYDLPAGACGRVACQPGNVRCNERPVVIRGDTVGGYGKPYRM